MAAVCVLLCASVPAALSQWSDPVYIARGDTPDMAIDPGTGRIFVLTMGTDGGAWITITDSVGNKLQEAQMVPHSQKDIGSWNFGARIALDPDGYPHVCYRDNVNTDEYLFDVYYTYQDASGWYPPLLITNDTKRAYVVPMDIDAAGLVHIGRSEAQESIWGPVTYYRIKDGYVDKITPGFEPWRGDNRLAIKAGPDGHVHMVLGCPGLPDSGPDYEGVIAYFHSTNSGNTWSGGLDIHSWDCGKRNGAPDMFVDTLGTVHVCYGAREDRAVDDHPSVRYVQLKNGTIQRDLPVTWENALEPWSHKDYGLASIAGTPDGQILAIAYLTKDVGDVYVTMSMDAGQNWSAPEKVATYVGDAEGRNMHIIRSYRNHFYLAYPSDNRPRTVYMRYLRDVGDEAPAANAGGPYSGKEGATIHFDGSMSTDPGQNSGIVEYAWDVDGNGEYDVFSETPSASYTYPDDFEGNVVLRVTDLAGKTSTSTTTVQITNAAPVVNAGQDMSGNEGDEIVFECQISDGAEDTHDVQWTFGDGGAAGGNPVTHTYRDNGSYKVRAVVVDDDGGQGKDSLTITVANVPPVADAGGPYRTPIHVPVTLTGTVTDAGVDDTFDYAWDTDGNLTFETKGRVVTRSYDQNGQVIIWFRVTDDDGGMNTDSTMLTIANDPPVIAGIQDQEIDEGGNFEAVDLDAFVEDPDQAPDEMNWIYRGNTDLLVTLNNHILAVAVPDSEWHGMETLTLVVTDPGDEKDSTTVGFRVRPVNDPPQWIVDMPDMSMDEDQRLAVSVNDLMAAALDVDDSPGSLQFSVSGNHHISFFYDQDSLILQPETDWHGQEVLTFVVTDTAGASDTETSRVNVVSVPDYPEPFSLKDPMFVKYDEWPDSVMFRWHTSADADSGETVEYEWILTLLGTGTFPDVRAVTGDTFHVYRPAPAGPDGTYLWWVTATDPTNLPAQSENKGILVIGEVQTDVPGADNPVPAEYALLPNYPNPFNPQTLMTFHLPEPARVRLAVYNTLGQEMAVLVSRDMAAGVHTVVWDGRDRAGRMLPSGIYITRMRAGDRVFQRKMMFLR